MRRVIVLVLALLAGPAAAAPLEAYGRLRTLEDAELSPDGRKLALVVTDGEQRSVLVRLVDTGENRALVRAGSQKLRDISWAGSDHLLLTTSVTSTIEDVIAPRGEWYTVQALDLNTGRLRALLATGKQTALNVALAAPQARVVSGRPYAFITGVHFVDNRGRAGLFRVDLTVNRNELAVQGTPSSLNWLVDSDGAPLAMVERDGDRARWALKVRDGRGWREIRSEVAEVETPYLAGMGRSPGSLLLGDLQEGATVYHEYDLASGTWSEPLPIEDESGFIFNRSTRLLAGTYRLVGDEDVYEFFEPQLDRAWRAIVAAFPGQRVTLVSASEDRRRFVVHVDSPDEGPALSFVDLDTGRAKWIGSIYQGLTAEDIAPVRPVRYRAGDGLEISGYLTLPRGREARALPLVVLPHGGPAARDTPGFDWWAQALASRGYAVLQPNFRGSAGYGRAFLERGYGEWGRKMQTDLSDGVRHLVAEGTVDPARVCVVGGSYGGYAALAGAAFDPGVYRCAASVNGVAELRQMLETNRRPGRRASLRYWSRFMGVEGPADPKLAEISPGLNAEKIDIPVLLVHGTDDTVVPLRQSQIMAEAMRKAGKNADLVVLKGDDHWLSRGETRLQMLRSLVAFLERHSPPD